MFAKPQAVGVILNIKDYKQKKTICWHWEKVRETTQTHRKDSS